MHGAHITCWNAHHTLRKKCMRARACAQMPWCRSFFAMEAIANLSWVLREHRTGCCLPPALATPPAVSTKPVAGRCSLKNSVQSHASSWRSRRCGVAQASFDRPRWCRPHLVCLWVALALGHGAHPSQKSIFAIFCASFSVYPASWLHPVILTSRNSTALQSATPFCRVMMCVTVRWSVCSVMHTRAPRVQIPFNAPVQGLCSLLQCVAVCCNVS